jgi:4-hydroxybenzoate polyprenyltransferase
MVALQASIGALNDIVDSASDAGRKPGKPIPSGVVSTAFARRFVALAAATGVALAAVSGPWLVMIATLILAVGYGYDVRAKGTRWSWVPFAFGIPLLPVFAWFGVAGRLPASFAILVPAAMVAGSALAIANTRADLERDTAAGQASVATWLGAGRAWAVSAVLFGVVFALALGSLWLWGAPSGSLGAAAGASAIIALGLALGFGESTPPSRRERAWQIQAAGVAVLAAAWLAGLGDLG